MKPNEQHERKEKKRKEKNCNIIFVKRWLFTLALYFYWRWEKVVVVGGPFGLKLWGDGDEHLWWVMGDGWWVWCVFVFFWLRCSPCIAPHIYPFNSWDLSHDKCILLPLHSFPSVLSLPPISIVSDCSGCLKPHASSLFTYSLEKKERPHKDIRAWPCNGCWVGSKLANPNAKPSLSSGLRPLLSTRAILRELVIFTMKARYLKGGTLGDLSRLEASQLWNCWELMF